MNSGVDFIIGAMLGLAIGVVLGSYIATLGN